MRLSNKPSRPRAGRGFVDVAAAPPPPSSPMSKITKPKRNYLYSPYDLPSENAEEDMMDPVLSGLPSNLTRNLWDDWNEESVLQDDTTLANFASGMDMTYEEKPPQQHGVSLLDSIMAEGNAIKSEEDGGLDMMSPPTSSDRRLFTHDISEMLLPPPAITSNFGFPKDTMAHQSNASSSNVYSQYASQKGMSSMPVSPPRETMANVPGYSPPAPPMPMSRSSSMPTNVGTQHSFHPSMGGHSVQVPQQQSSSMFAMNSFNQPAQMNHMAQQQPQPASNNGGSFMHLNPMGHQAHQQTSSYNTATSSMHSGFQGPFAMPPHMHQHTTGASNFQGTPLFNGQPQQPPTSSSNSMPSTNGGSSAFGQPAPMMMPTPGFMMYNNPMMGFQPHPTMMQQYAAMGSIVPPSPMNMTMPFPLAAMAPAAAATATTVGPLLAKPPLKPHVPLARKPGTGEISSMLQSLLDEEAEKRDKKLERNRDSARESRKKQQKYVEVLEEGIQHLQISKESLIRYRFGRSPPVPAKELELMCGLSPQLPSLAIVVHAARQKRMLGCPKTPLLDKVFAALTRTVSLLQSSLLEMQMLWDADSNGLDHALGLSPTQVQQLQDMGRAVRRTEMTRLVLLVKAFKALRHQAHALGSFAPSLDVYFRAVLSPDQVNKMVTWSEANRGDLLRLEWRTQT
ncbi:Aste57867_10602 [Aphanomyces stellatus]|uniref:Aste57867_10602 protein n=1 Tax=Aphanomyces stellatus TaxID=120398 RepID=A0A485KSB8_9STRA|nr:hypothetical protein As57867_010562 [Aphanomyces stellatus]VFT87474.1 Aste57867_10602 [Aphanomyces stellatus]